MPNDLSRRTFLKIMGLTGAAAAGCGKPPSRELMPYVIPDENVIPGVPAFYSAMCSECAAGCGVVARVREGRVIKLEGNPQDPINAGALCARGQAALQGLYHPDRLRQPQQRRHDGVLEPIAWEAALHGVAERLRAAQSQGADRVAFIGPPYGPTLERVTGAWLQAWGSQRLVRYEAFDERPARAAAQRCFGRGDLPVYHLDAAAMLLSFGADFLETWISPVQYTRAFAEAHGFRDGGMARFVAVEPRRGLTAFSADEWVAPRPGTEGLLALGIAGSAVRQGRSRLAGAEADRVRGFLARFTARSVAATTGVDEAVIDRLAREFTAAEPSLAVGGGVACQHRAATQTAVAVHLLNYVAGNVGRTVRFEAGRALDRLSRYADATALVAAMGAGTVDVALVHEANPAFTLPKAAGFAAAFEKVRLKVAFASQYDETAALCDLILPDHTPLEQWGVVESVAGTRSFVQPAMTPVFDTRQTADLLLAVAEKAGKQLAAGAASARDLVTKGLAPAALKQTLQHGGQFGPAAQRPVRLAADFARTAFQPPAFDGDAGSPVLVVYPSAALFDGRGANKGWLQEQPDVATKIAWQTWVEVHPDTAHALGVENGDVVTVASPHGSVEAPVYVYPGVRRDVVAMPIGQGHTEYGRNAKGRGANPLDLLAADATDASGALAFCSTRVKLTRTGRSVRLATTEGSARQLGRGIARAVTVAGARNGEIEPAPEATITESERTAIAEAATSQRQRAFVGEYAKPQPKWEMVVDLSRCTGCSACMTACYAENNIAVVGEEQTQRHRGMAWIRLERYLEGDTSGTDWQVRQIPMLCQQCENAPCEPVCPVYAAYHTPDGLNGQVYNRCVGTRYCANNCPYKVRYFNWWDYGTVGDPYFAFPEPLNWQLNPDVTVRTKGVMEKCTFCIQRIRFAQNDAKVRNRELADGDITPACVQTCPADALAFGDARLAGSRVSRAREDARGYRVFEMLNARPGITYLERVIDDGKA